MATTEAILTAECLTLGTHLLGEEPDPGVVVRYVAWHRSEAGLDTDVDDRLVDAARKGRLSLAMADAFASRFRPHGPLRRKLVLILALAECSPGNAARLDRAGGHGPLVALASMAAIASGEVFLLAAAVLRFGLFGGRET